MRDRKGTRRANEFADLGSWPNMLVVFYFVVVVGHILLLFVKHNVLASKQWYPPSNTLPLSASFGGP